MKTGAWTKMPTMDLKGLQLYFFHTAITRFWCSICLGIDRGRWGLAWGSVLAHSQAQEAPSRGVPQAAWARAR